MLAMGVYFVKLRYYQEECKETLFNYFVTQSGNPLIAMPTGSGKSLVIASFIADALKQWPNQRILMLTHVKELIEQNAATLKNLWANAPLGLYSAGLNQRDAHRPIVFGGVQSVAPALKKGVHFGRRDLIIIDEAHLLGDSETSQYRFVIGEFLKLCPQVKVIGFTATPFRMRKGLLTSNGLFTDVCYDLTTMTAFNRLIAQGYLAPLIAKATKTEIDISKVKITAGEFNAKQLEKAANADDIVNSAVREMLELAYDRKSWMIFATGIDNTEHIASVIQSYGLQVLPVHSKLSNKLNAERLAAFKAGELRGLVSGQKLTTGFDHPEIDFIGDLNPTLSPGKHVQKLGRGTRPAPGKVNCLYADFGGNVKRLGPINDPAIPKPPGQKTDQPAPVKICPECDIYNHASVKVCVNCGHLFKTASKVQAISDTRQPLADGLPQVETFSVRSVVYKLHTRPGKPKMLRVLYRCDSQTYQEFVLLEHSGYAGKKARDWWRQRHRKEAPASVIEALELVSELKVPKSIKVWVNKKYPEVLTAEL